MLAGRTAPPRHRMLHECFGIRSPETFNEDLLQALDVIIGGYLPFTTNPQNMLLRLCCLKTRVPCQVLRSLICWQGMIRLRRRNSFFSSSGMPCECTDSRTQRKTRALLTASNSIPASLRLRCKLQATRQGSQLCKPLRRPVPFWPGARAASQALTALSGSGPQTVSGTRTSLPSRARLLQPSLKVLHYLALISPAFTHHKKGGAPYETAVLTPLHGSKPLGRKAGAELLQCTPGMLQVSAEF